MSYMKIVLMKLKKVIKIIITKSFMKESKDNYIRNMVPLRSAKAVIKDCHQLVIAEFNCGLDIALDIIDRIENNQIFKSLNDEDHFINDLKVYSYSVEWDDLAQIDAYDIWKNGELI